MVRSTVRRLAMVLVALSPLLTARASETPQAVGAPTSVSASPTPSASATPAPTSRPGPAAVKTPVGDPGDKVALSKFAILKSPCQYLRRMKFIDAMGSQTWKALEKRRTPKDADWETEIEPRVVRAGAVAASECLAVANSKRYVQLKVVAMRTVAGAKQQLADDQKWPGLGEQADLGLVDPGGSGIMRIGRVYIHVVFRYENVKEEDGRLIVRDMLSDLRAGFPKTR
jgi:hypothetical protein